MFLFLKVEQTERTKLASVYEDKSYFFHNNTRRTLGHKMWFYSAAIKEYYFYREECTVYRTVYHTIHIKTNKLIIVTVYENKFFCYFD